MMKIGILTFHYGSNYGGVLQCYALQQVLKDRGHEVKVINYVPNDAFKKFAHVALMLLKSHNFRGLKAALHYIRYHKTSRNVFRRFREKYLLMTEKHSNVDAFKGISCDMVIVGSDQVWNYSQQKYRDYFLGWLDNPSIKKVSYAACCGANGIDDQYRDNLITQLNQFSAISVRSNETKLFVRQLLGKDVPIVLDPTMLYDYNEFTNPLEEKYILTYILIDDIKGGNENAMRVIREKYEDLPVYSIIISDRIPRLCCWADEQLYDVNPEKWVNLICNCSFLFTDSYHGCLFAMKFQRPFIAYYRDRNKGKRLLDLKEMFNLNNIVTTVEEVTIALQNNAENVNVNQTKIEDYKSLSLNFIDSELCCS